ncbi:uncharacterized protein A4U43_C10F5030 [Asparagus officinalis]|uniref:SAM domain-containing protein n=1 Tax=Asparagus officinalis TaxID=4686 RepID=A0A5P1E3W8_ASPOF|nr:ankyrin repeat and SAM domain-containing protein 6-like isoform X2 [Asparagus officinalis]ONK56187.1 uncharacterized protein A4U43_C10F5030 [Asparagus officinalis]
MYADRVATGAKRSIRDRLDGNLVQDLGRNRSDNSKRQRRDDDKWKHDLYDDGKGPQVSKSNVGSSDLRLKLQKKALQQTYQGGSEGVRDLREKLSGTMKSQPTTVDPLKAKAAPAKVASESGKPVKKSVLSTQTTVTDTKKLSAPASSSKKPQKKPDLTVDGLLRSLGLEKYSIQFQAEEVDMTALTHMNDDDLKALGVPMGPRKKILLALDSKT